MQSLEQKKHGLPGTCLIGVDGSTGTRGKNIYIGHINDFFDMIDIHISNEVKLGIHTTSINDKSYIDNIIIPTLKKDIQNTSSIEEGQEIWLTENDASLLAQITNKYYTAGRLEAGSDNITYYYDVDNNAYLIQIALSNYAYADASNKINPSTGAVINKDFPYTSIENYATENYLLLDMFQHELDPGAGLYILGDNESLYMQTPMNTKEIDRLEININDYLTALDSSLEPITGAAYPAAIKEVLNINNSSVYTDIYNITNTSVNLNNSQHPVDNTYITQIIGLDTSEYQSHTMTMVGDGVLFTDGDSKEHYSLTIDTLYDNNGLKSFDDIWNDVSAQYPWSAPEANTSTYVNLYNQSASDSSAIIWTTDDTQLYRQVPLYLKSDFIPGDTIYYTLQTMDNDNPATITYKIVLTEEMLAQQITPTMLIQNSQFVNPLDIKYFEEQNGRTVTHLHGSVIDASIDASDPSTDSSIFIYNALNNILTANSDPALLIVSDWEVSTENVLNKTTLELNVNINDPSAAIIANASFVNDNNGQCIKASNLKLSSFYIKNTYPVENLEKNSVINENIKLYDIYTQNHYIKPVDDIDLYVLNDEPFFCYNLKSSDYFVTDSSDNIYGYEVYDVANSQMVSHEFTNDTSLMMSIHIDPEINDTRTINYDILVYATSQYGLKHYSPVARFSLDIEDGNYKSFGITLPEIQSLYVNESDDIIYNIPALSFNETSTALSGSIEYDIQTISILSTPTVNVPGISTKITGDTITIDVSSNFPDVDSKTLDDYMITKWDGSEQTPDAPLFMDLLTLYQFPSSNPRSSLIKVQYKKNLSEDPAIQKWSEPMWSSFYVTQPGFTDYRKLPEVKLNLHTEFNELQDINQKVAANKFVTYLDVQIPDFYTSWCRYNDKAKLSVRIKNVPYDQNWVNKYNSTLTSRAMIKMVPDEDMDYLGLQDIAFMNYVKFNMECENAIVDPDDVDVSYGLTGDNDTPIWLDKTHVELLKNINELNTGFLGDITIDLKDLAGVDVENQTFRFKIEFEMGNPVLANLFLQFYVQEIKVAYDYDNEHTYTFTAHAPADIKGFIEIFNEQSSKNMSLYTWNNVTRRLTLTMQSNALDVTFHPISVTAAPLSEEKRIGNVTGAGVLSGSTEQIKHEIRRWGADILNQLAKVTQTDIINGKLYDWGNSIPKYAYFQDNVQKITVTPHTTTIDNGSNVSKDTFLSIVYSSNVLPVRRYDNQDTFRYNNKTYAAARYSQFENRKPLFYKDELSLLIRDDKLYNSINIWNFEMSEYMKSNTIRSTANIFDGVVNSCGNGYVYLPNAIDEGQYGSNKATQDIMYKYTIGQFNTDGIFSLKDVKAIGNAEIIDKFAEDIQLTSTTPATPLDRNLFRTLLYNLRWECPILVDNQLTAYMIVSDADVNMAEQPEQPDPLSYQEMYMHTLNNSLSYSLDNNIISAFKLYELSPRIIYNYKADVYGCFMLRRPSIGEDNDRMDNELNTTYKMSRYYMDGEPEVLEPPYD